MATLKPIPGRPGHFVDQSGKVIVLTEAREADRYDTENQATGAITAGSSLSYFETKTDKKELDANFPEPNKLVTGSERFVMEWLGVNVQPASGTNIATGRDIKRVVAHGFLEFRLNRNVVEDGPLERFPSGYGLSGSSAQSNEAVINLGVPATASVRGLKEQQVVTDQHTVKCSITFPSRAWLTTGTLPTLDSEIAIRIYCHGILESAATNN